MILVTGATGFLGAELIHQLLRQGQKIRALHRQNSIIPSDLERNDHIEWVIADICDAGTLEDVFTDIQQVYHCAALVSFDPKDKTELLKINIEGTSNIVNLCVLQQARLVHVSSVAALGEPKKQSEITENDYWEYDAKSHSYAISKYEGEMEVWRGIAEGLDAVIVNPSVIIGANAGFKGSGAIFKVVKDGLKYYTSGATGFVDVADVAKSMIALMATELTAERFIISAGNIYYKDLFTQIAKGFGVPAPTKLAKPWMMGLAWRAAKLMGLFTGKTAALTSDAAISSLKVSLYNNDKIKNTINITFKPVQESIQDVCAVLKN